MIRRRRREAESSTPQPEPTVLDHYIRSSPSAQNAVDLFAGEWSTALPEHVGAKAGDIGLFADARVRWIIDCAGGVDDLRVLELGPLEASHTAMLEAAGAQVTAIEGNGRAYLKCLVVKELLGLRESRFLLGDFVAYMEETDERFDLVLASGVLYHAPEPLRMLAAMAGVTDRIGIWTHYFHPVLTAADEWAARLFLSEPFVDRIAGVDVTLHRRDYREALGNAGFCGGPEESAVWMELDDLVAVLHALGFDRVEVTDDDTAHPYGPCALLYAARS